MKITAQEEYGLRCLLRLAKAAEGQSLTLPEVATAEGLSVPYAAKLLSVLRHAGLIESVRRRSGGGGGASGWPGRRRASGWARCCWCWANRCSTSPATASATPATARRVQVVSTSRAAARCGPCG